MTELKAVTRKEKLIKAAITGEPTDIKGITREEKLWEYAAENGGISGSDNTNQGLEFNDTNVTRTVSVDVDDTITKQEYLGGYIEIQPDSWDGEVCATDSTTKTWGFPISLLNSEQSKIKDTILKGNGKGIMYIRFPLGFAYRGYRNIDSTTSLAKNIGERFPGQNARLKLWFEDIANAGGGLAPEYWCPSPYWVTSGSYSGTNELWAGGSNARTVKLADIKDTDSTQYNQQISDFTDAIVEDLEYLHQNIAPVRMFALQNEPSHSIEKYGACKYDAQTYNDVLVALAPKIKASTILSTYNDEPNEVKLLVASSDEGAPFTGIAKTFIDNHADLIWGYTHHMMRKASGESTVEGKTGADWYKTNDYKTLKGSKDNVICNEFEYFNLDTFDDNFRCSNNMLHLINESVYGGAKILHPVIHICKPIGQTLNSTNTKGYCLFAANLKGTYGSEIYDSNNEYCLSKGTTVENTSMYNSWAMFNDNLPVGSYLVGNYSETIDNSGWCVYKYGGKLYIFMANNSDKDVKITLTFKSEQTLEGKMYSMDYCGEKIKTKKGTTIDFVIPAYSGQCWISEKAIKTEKTYIDLNCELGGISSSTGLYEDSNQKIRTKDYIEVSGSTVTIKSDVSNTNCSYVARFYDSSKNFLSASSNDLSSKENIHTLPEGTKYMKLLFVNRLSSGNLSTDFSKINGSLISIDSKYYTIVYQS